MSEEQKYHLHQILNKCVEMGASDLHITAGIEAMARVNGDLVFMDTPKLMPQDIKALMEPLLTNEQKEILQKDLELDFSYAVPGAARFRGNIMWQRGSLAVNFRVVAFDVPSLSDLGLPAVVGDFAHLPRGLVLVTGPTGSGKSTTLAAIIDKINRERTLNMITVENPIEFLHRHNKSIIKQREVGTDTHSFANALRHALRHDPDVILIGEMRDLESISIALTAAETGHLVFSTLHTQTATLTLNRIIDVFSEGARDQIRQQLADSLQGIIAQQLVPRLDGKGRAVASEVLLTTPAVKNLIREGKTHQLSTILQTGRNVGMHTMDHSLASLVLSGAISREVALERCVDQAELARVVRQHSPF
ncbi:MAG: type IV pilus twitching motility protein PilT [Firmicutes bacterium]|nr:type IV pilus twitching motility protein PilT [Bacillota bacterium]